MIRFRTKRYDRLLIFAMVIDDDCSAYSWRWRAIRRINGCFARLLQRTRFDVMILDAAFVREYWD